MLPDQPPTPLVPLTDETTQRAGVRLFIKRDDLIHPTVSGNKWRKLKYVLRDAREKGFGTLLTFGGAWSNHLYATAAAANVLGFNVVGVVRGEEYRTKPTATLRFCEAQGMVLHYVSRQNYRRKKDAGFLDELTERFGSTYLVSEGGSTPLALPGVAELVAETEAQLGRRPDHFAVAAGTGGTAAGLLSAAVPTLAFAALKNGGFLKEEIVKLVPNKSAEKYLHLFTDYSFGGYAKHSPELLGFMKTFEEEHGVPLEHVYTGKMLYGLYDLMKQGYFAPQTTLVAVHTGGLQGRTHEG